MTRRLFVVALLFAGACSRSEPAPTFHAVENPQLLSAWGMMAVDGNTLVLSEGVAPYDLATPLFSDYASKLRTVWIPPGETIRYHSHDAFEFPVGTVVTKTFYYRQDAADPDRAVLQEPAPTVSDARLSLSGLRLIETRILVRRASGWAALPYIWNADQTDATLKRTGDINPLELVRNDGRRERFSYLVPNQNQCAGCHATNATTKALQPIGLKARHLNKPSTFADGFNQLDLWKSSGRLSGGDIDKTAARNALWNDPLESLDHRARSYLDANCSHCHNPHGPADTSGLNLEPNASGPALGVCKTPVAAGGGTGGRPFDIVPGDPDQSITIFRMETADPGAMMPELGRAVRHEEGVALIAAWIKDMNGGCS